MLPVKANLLPTVSRLFEDDWNNIFDWTNRHFNQAHTTLPSVNIEDGKDHIIINMAVPGLDKKDIQIELKDNILSVSGESKIHKEENSNENFSVREFNYSSFQRSFNLNDSYVDDQSIDANYKDGILSIKLAKKEEAKAKAPRRINIK